MSQDRIQRDGERVVVAGQGYVGLPIAMLAYKAGYTVVGYEPNRNRSKRLLDGDSYVEDVSNDLLSLALRSGRYVPTDRAADCVDFDVAVITVPTPLRDGAPDLSFIEESARELAGYVRRGSTVILESTTYPGTTEELLAPILESGSGLRAGEDFHLGYSPERIDPGNVSWSLENTPKIVSGVTAESLAAVKSFYDTLVEQTVPVSSPKVAELTKLLENTFRHVNIALVNELAMFASDLGVDIWEAVDAASSKPFGFMRFTPGPGVGGHCLPVDPSYLSWKVKQLSGSSFRFVELANDINDHMPHYVARRVGTALNRDKKSVNGSRILVLGMSFKRNSADARESPSPVLCDVLTALGANVRVSDPCVKVNAELLSQSLVALTESELSAADIVVVITDHDAFDWELISRCAPRILDTRHRLEPARNVEFL